MLSGAKILRSGTTLGLLLIFAIAADLSAGCQFYPVGEYLKFVRVAENLPLGSEILTLEVHPRSHLSITPVDKEEDLKHFAYRDVNATHVSVVLAQSLEDLVDADAPRNLLKFRLGCDYSDGTNSLVSSHLSVTVYVEDVNDHSPQFVDAPYHVTVDELSPVGLTIFRGIHAFDKDKPGTPNSDVHYAIIKGNERATFSLESAHRTALILKKQLDYDSGEREYSLVISASDRGTPPKSTNTTIAIVVVDNDDLDPKFTQDVYRTEIFEFYPLPSRAVPKEVEFATPIRAIDQDRDIDIPLRYEIISGNERRIFHLDPRNGTLYLQRPVDLDAERNLPGNTFVLQIHASQVDNPLKVAAARAEILVLDLNDNLPEFEVDFYNISIVENLPNGFSVLQVVAYDRDQGENGEFSYELRDPTGAFSVDAGSGWLTVQNQSVLDREKTSFLQMKVYAVEKRPSVVKPYNSSSVDVEVTLLDANDNNPLFVPGNLLELLAQSDFKAGTIVGQVHAVDKDQGTNGQVRYKLQKPGNFSGAMPFAVNAETGVITVAESPIVEGRHAIFIEASDQPANPSEKRFSLAVVTVDVFRPDGQGSKVPDFIGAPYEFWVGANVPVGTSVGQIRVNEAVNGKEIIYDLLHSYHEGVPFAVEERSGTITVVDEIERYKQPSYDFEAVVMNEKSLSLVTNVSIHVVDPNDESGIFTKGATKSPLVFHVRENAAGAYIGQVIPANATTALKNVRFLIANQQDAAEISVTETGMLYTPTGLDREKRSNYSLTVIAESPRGVGVFQVITIVDDEDDNAPIFSASSYEGRISENSVLGSEVIMTNHVSARDPDEDASIVFTLRGEGSDLFRIDNATGRVFLSAEDLLDREEKPLYNLRIVAGEGKKESANVSLTIRVEDENDNAPSFAQMLILPGQGIRVSKDQEPADSLLSNRSPVLYVPENVTIGLPIIRLVARDADEGKNAELTYSVASEVVSHNGSSAAVKRYFVVDSRSGEISVAGTPPAEADVVLEVTAKDPGGLVDNVTLRMHVFDVNDHAPVFERSYYSFDIAEGGYERFQIGRIVASDADFGDNANVSYELVPVGSDKHAKFEISRHEGVFSVTGSLDRETRDLYTFKVVAKDNGTAKMYSTVDVELRVQDVNDNAPAFHGYQEVGHMPAGSPQELAPVYYSSVPENSQTGTVVTRLYANDSDFTGNGLVLYDLLQVRGQTQHFAIDNKEGVVTTIGNLDYETESIHNLTIVASDLGSPSLSSTALLVVRVLDVDEGPTDPKRPVFQHRYYEVEVDENANVPLKILELSVSEAHRNEQIRYSIVMDGEGDAREHFSLDPRNGSLYLLTSPDREARDRYELKARVDKVKTGRGMPVMIYPVVGERLNGLGPNEARIVLKVRDVNDNAPKFKGDGRPILAAVPTSALYGYNVVKIQAEDPDEGRNGQIRYRIMSSGKEEALKFAIDPVSGQVQSAAASLAKDSGRVFGFDVKATDRAGAEDGRSSIVNVFIYVLDDNKQLVMIMGKKPLEIESEIQNITRALKNVTGLDVRVRKIEPHLEKNLIDGSSSDMYLYAVDPNLNVMIDTETLQNVFRSKKSEIKRELERYRVLDIAGGGKSKRANQHFLLSTLEVAVIVLGCVVFLGAIVTTLCVTCVRRNKRQRRYGSSVFHAPVGFALAEPGGGKPSLFPAFVGGAAGQHHHYDPSGLFSNEMRQHSFCEHEPNCVRFHSCSNSAGGVDTSNLGSSGAGGGGGGGGNKRGTRRGTTNLETSATSLHSSGQDSGIVAENGNLRACHCSNSSSPSSGESSNGYEDSLKSLQHQHQQHQQQRARGRDHRSSSNNNSDNPSKLSHKRHRFHSFTNLESIYQPEAGDLHSDRRFQTMLLNQKQRNGSNGGFTSTTAIYSSAHRRTFSDAENLNNITETVIQEHPMSPRSLGTLPSSTSATSFLHGKGKAMIGGVASATGGIPTLLRPTGDNERVIYARPRRNFT